MKCSFMLSEDSFSRQLDLSFLGTAQFFLKVTRLVLSCCCLSRVQMLSLIPFLLGFNLHQNFEYHLFQVQSNLSFS